MREFIILPGLALPQKSELGLLVYVVDQALMNPLLRSLWELSHVLRWVDVANAAESLVLSDRALERLICPSVETD